MTTRFFRAAASGNNIFRLLAVSCLCVLLAACTGSSGSSGSGGKTEGLGDPGSKKTVAYGISITVPTGWTVVDSVAPGSVSNAELESRVKGGQPPVPLLVMILPGSAPQQIEARTVVYLADSSKHMPPEQAITTMPQPALDELARNTLQQQNEIARKNNQPSQTLEWNITRETVGGHMALFNRVLGQSEQGKVRAQMWYVYLPNGIGIGIENMGNADHPGIDAMMESIARSLTVAPGN